MNQLNHSLKPAGATGRDPSDLPIAARLENGSRIAVLGGGPAGSLSACFLLSFARRMDLDIGVVIYEPRDFTRTGPAGCNMCGGIVSESLVQGRGAEPTHEHRALGHVYRERLVPGDLCPDTRSRFLGRFLRESARAAAGALRVVERRLVMDEGALGRDFSDGEVICRQGERGDRMFVIQAGRVSVFHEEAGLEAVVGELSVGDIFGEMAVFDQLPRSASVRANGNARVLTIDKRALLSRVNEDPSLAYRMLEEMSQRIRSLDAEVSRLKGSVPAVPGDSQP